MCRKECNTQDMTLKLLVQMSVLIMFYDIVRIPIDSSGHIWNAFGSIDIEKLYEWYASNTVFRIEMTGESAVSVRDGLVKSGDMIDGCWMWPRWRDLKVSKDVLSCL